MVKLEALYKQCEWCGKDFTSLYADQLEAWYQTHIKHAHPEVKA